MIPETVGLRGLGVGPRVGPRRPFGACCGEAGLHRAQLFQLPSHRVDEKSSSYRKPMSCSLWGAALVRSPFPSLPGFVPWWEWTPSRTCCGWPETQPMPRGFRTPPGCLVPIPMSRR